MSKNGNFRTGAVRLVWWLSVPFILVPLLIAVFILPGEFSEIGRPWGLIVVIAIMMLSMWPMAFSAHWIEIKNDGITLRYWPLMTCNIKYTSIISCNIEHNITFSSVGGIGFRIPRSGSIAFANRSGPGIVISTDNGKVFTLVVPRENDRSRVMNQILSNSPNIHR